MHPSEVDSPGIKSLNKQAVLTHLHEALWRTDENQEKQLVRPSGIERNWDGIKMGLHPDRLVPRACQPILAARLSSRPMAWSLQGAENMALCGY